MVVAAFVLLGAIGCESEEIPEPTVEVATVAAVASPVVTEPTAIGVEPPTATVVATAAPTVTIVPDTPTIEVPPTATPTVEVRIEGTGSDDLDLVSLTERTYELTIMLAEELSPRQSATDEELRGAMFLLEEMEALGYEVELQEFEVVEAGRSGSIEVLPAPQASTPSVSFSRRDGETSRIFFLPFEPPKTGQVDGELVFVGLGDVQDFEGVDVEGKIVLMSRGTLSFEDKETNAADQGAIGVVVFNNEPRFYFGGQLAQEPDILAGGIPKSDGEKLRDALADGEEFNIELLVYPDGNGPSRNVIAELDNELVGDPVVVIGAHYDTTPWTPGANDNGSGVASALIVAAELADDELPFDLRFVFFGSEETGLHGSEFYADSLTTEELERIDAMINLDVVATGDLHAFGDASLVSHAENTAEDLEIDLEITQPFEWGASDYVAFNERDVPFLMIHAHDLRFINHPSDVVAHVEAEPLGGTVAIVLGMIEQLADGFER